MMCPNAKGQKIWHIEHIEYVIVFAIVDQDALLIELGRL